MDCYEQYCKEKLEKKKEEKVKEILQKKKNDYYSILELPKRDCSADDVKRAYLKLSLLVHPDKNTSPDATEVFQVVLDAYQFLKTKKKSDKENYRKAHSYKQPNDAEEKPSGSGPPKNPYSEKGRSSFDPSGCGYSGYRPSPTENENPHYHNPDDHFYHGSFRYKPRPTAPKPKFRKPGVQPAPKGWARRRCEMCGASIFGVYARYCTQCEDELDM